jgi:hypothetical protein
MALPFDRPHGKSPDSSEPRAPLGGTRREALQRLQIGLSLLGGVILLVGLASAIEHRAEQTDAAAVTGPATAAAASASPTPQKDPLADAGVVPDLPATNGTSKPQPAPAPGGADADPAR